MNDRIRAATYTKEFDEYYQNLPQKIKDKYDFVFEIMLTKYVVSTKFVKRMGGQFMIKICEEKWAKLPQIDDRLTEKYGPVGSPSRKEFQAKAEAWYYAELLRDERKRQKLTQQELGERIGKKREYISSLEQGKTDMQLSTFMLIAKALGLRFSLVVG